MRIVIDTNVLISAAFYAGFVKKFFDEIGDKYTICGNSRIIDEYYKTKEKMISKNLGRFNAKIFNDFLEKVQSFEIESDLKICRGRVCEKISVNKPSIKFYKGKRSPNITESSPKIMPQW